MLEPHANKVVIKQALLLLAACAWIIVAPACSTPSKLTTPNATTVMDGNNRLAFDLYGKLREKKGNLFFSPYGISTALAMTYAGARGETAVEMARVLHFNLPPETLHATMRDFNEEISSDGRKRDDLLISISALWSGEDVVFQPEYLRLLKDNYGIEMTTASGSQDRAQAINAWAKRQSQGKIEILISDDAIKQGVEQKNAVTLASAAYFKGAWDSAFKADETKPREFMLTDGTRADVPMMSQMGKFRYARDDDFQLLELPYKGDDIVMTVLLPIFPHWNPYELPKNTDFFSAPEKQLTLESLNKLLASSKKSDEEMSVWLPKFKFSSEFDLKESLESLGMHKVFQPDNGLTGMTDLPAFLSAARHRSLVEVNEKGTEAMSFTFQLYIAFGMPPPFHANHPFLFFIRHKPTGAILFMGRVNDPRKE